MSVCVCVCVCVYVCVCVDIGSINIMYIFRRNVECTTHS